MGIADAIKVTQVEIRVKHVDTGAEVKFNDFLTAASFLKIPIAGVYVRPRVGEWRVADIRYVN